MPESVDAAVGRVQALLAGFAEGDRAARARAEELVRVLMELYGAALRNIMEAARDSGNGLAERLADDKLVGSLLLVHGLHPVDAEARIRRVLARIGRHLDGQSLVLAGIDGAVATVRLEPGGPAPETLAASIEEAVLEAAPEIEQVRLEGVVPALVHITVPGA